VQYNGKKEKFHAALKRQNQEDEASKTPILLLWQYNSIDCTQAQTRQLMRQAKRIAESSLEKAIAKRNGDYAYIKTAIRDDLAKFIFKETKRKPMILPVIMDV